MRRAVRSRAAVALAWIVLAPVALLFGGSAVAANYAAAQRATAYRSIAVEQPAHGATVFDNAGDMDVVVSVSPELDAAAGDRIALILDGRTASVRAATRFKLTGVARGEHSLEARVLDSGGNVLISSGPVNFHMWQASRLFPNRRAH